jgi:hypothetical protein
MPTAQHFQNWISKTAIQIYRGLPLYLGLSKDTLTSTSTIYEVLESELLPIDGYTRKLIAFASDGSYSTLLKRHEMGMAQATFSSDINGLSWQFKSAFYIENGTPTPSWSFGPANVDVATNRITINNHGMVAGQKLIFTADTNATLPVPLNSTTTYFVVNPTTNDVQIAVSTAPNTAVDITSTGTGTLRARNANGELMGLIPETTDTVLQPGKDYIYQIPMIFANIGNSSGV